MKKRCYVAVVLALVLLLITGQTFVYAQNESSISELTDPFYQVQLSGASVEMGTQLLVTPLDITGDVVKEFQKQAATTQTLSSLFEVKLMKDNLQLELLQEATLKFPVDDSHNGQTLTVLCKAGETIETLSGKAENGVLTVSVKKLGSFAIVTGTAGSTASSSGAAGSTSAANSSVSTGDDNSIGLYTVMAAAALVTIGAVGKARRKQLLSLLLVMSLAAGMCPYSAWASAENTEDIQALEVMEQELSYEDTEPDDENEWESEKETEKIEEAKQELSVEEDAKADLSQEAVTTDMPATVEVKVQAETQGLRSTSQLQSDAQSAIAKAAAYQLAVITNPTCSTMGGEWTVIGLARSGNMTNAFKETYLANLYGVLEGCEGVLHKYKYTEYSRVTIALAALGLDARFVNGYDVLSYLADFEKVIYQGVNGPTFALIALDSRNYEVPQLPAGSSATQVTRENLISYILSQQCADGGWTLRGSKGDTDVTGMAVQALAPYYTQRTDVKAAVDEALVLLSNTQNSEGGYSSEGTGNSESCVQVLVALSALGIPATDERFVKNGNTVVDKILTYQNADGSFCHIPGDGGNAMATDQCMYALTAYLRCVNQENRLYDMSDVPNQGPTMSEDELRSAIKQVDLDGLTLDDEQNVTALQMELNLHTALADKQELSAILEAAKSAIDSMKAEVEALDEDIWNQIDPLHYTYKDKDTISALAARYHAIPEVNRSYLRNADSLMAMEHIMTVLESAEGEGFFAGPDEMFSEVQEVIVPTELKDGLYLLYHMNKENNEWYAVAQVEAKENQVQFSTGLGGCFALREAPAAAQSVKGTKAVAGGSTGGTNRSSSVKADSQIEDLKKISGTSIEGNTIFVENESGLLTQNFFEAVQEKEYILKVESEMENGSAYAVLFYGEDIKTPADVDTTITKSSEYEDKIRQLAENPYILHFAHEGELPGEMLVEIEIEREDGDYILFHYNEELQKAEYSQKVTVKEGKTQFILTHCSDYFIDTRAKAKSLLEEDNLLAQNEESVECVEETDQADTVALAESADEDTLAENQNNQTLWLAALVIVCILAGVVMSRKGRKKTE